MAVHAKRICLTVGGVLVLAFILFVVTDVVPSWSRIGDEENELTYGLWGTCNSSYNLDYKECYDLKCPDSENDINDYCGKILAARAFVTLSCILSAISAILFFLSAASNSKAGEILLVIGKSLAFLCLVIGIIGVAIGVVGTTEMIPETKLKWAGAPIVGIIAIVVNFVAAIGSLLVN